MRTSKYKTVNVSLIGFFLLLAMGILGAGGCSRSFNSRSVSSDDDILNRFYNLEDYIEGLNLELNADQRSLLEDIIIDARISYVDGDLCGAANILAQYLDETQVLRSAAAADTAEDLHNRGWMLRYDMLSVFSGVCSGYEKIGAMPKLLLSESDNTHVAGNISFGEPRMWTVEENGEVFTQLQIPGVAFPVSPEGYPAVPLYRRYVAVPRGAGVSVNAIAGGEQVIRMNLYPVQLQPVDAEDEELPFVQDEDAYAADENYPESVCSVHSMGDMRDVSIAEIVCAAGRYHPATDTMALYDSVDFEVTFNGGDGVFTTERALSPFDQTLPMVERVVINVGALTEYVDSDPVTTFYGEELLILTPPDLRQAADRLAEWKNDKGILTRVFNVCDGAGEGPDDSSGIDELIEVRYEAVRPSYVLLMGGKDFIPTFSIQPSSSDYGLSISTDYPYSVIGGEFAAAEDDFSLPDLAVGRIPATTLDEALVVVDKIIAYESDPPARDSFYQNVSVAGAFQCCRQVGENGWAERTFIEAMEFCRNSMLNEGYEVERIYSTIHCDADVPRCYYDGSNLPDDLLAENGFAWDGDTDDIIHAFTSDQGRFLIIHRDHGGYVEWVHPAFTTENIIDDLGNQNAELLPVVFSINCLTGAFQRTERCFADQLLHKEGGGAVGVFAATNLSPSYPNSELAKGFIDAVWPASIGDYGGNEEIHRLGDVLNYGKLYMLGQVGSIAEMIDRTEQYVSTRSRSDFMLFHCFGDPTLEIWTAQPGPLPGDADVEDIPDGIRVGYAVDGAIVTIYQYTPYGVVALGRGTVIDGRVDIAYVQDPDAGYPIEVSVNKSGYVAGIVMPTARTITASAGTGGSISPSGSVSVDYGSDREFTVGASTGYIIEDVLVDGVSQGAVDSYTFENVTTDHTITASFLPIAYTITATAGANGTIAPSGPTQVYYGNDQAFTITPDLHCHVADVLVDGVSAGARTSYTFSAVDSAHTIQAVFAVDTHILTILRDGDGTGTTTPSVGTHEYNYGTVVDLSASPSVSSVFAGWTGDIDPGVSAVTIDNDRSVTATFNLRTFSISASAGENGGIDPNGIASVTYGGSRVFTFTPADGYEVDTVIVDGEITAVTGNNYTFMDVTEDHTIEVTFRSLPVETTWSRTYGHAGWYTEYHTYGLDLTDDGGYVFAADGTYNSAGGYDFWVVRIDSQGDTVWETGFGGSSEDHPHVVRQADDGGFIVAGESYSYRTGTRYCDVWVVKLTSSGSIDWQYTYGGTGTEVAFDLKETFDSMGDPTGFLLSGYTNSFGAGGRDVWLVKLDASGSVIGEVALGGGGDEYGRSVEPTADGGCIVAADTQSFGAGGRDLWIVKLDSSFNVVWEKTFGGSGSEIPNTVAATDDGGYIVGAKTNSFGAGNDDYWAIKLDAGGALAWQYTYGGTDADAAQGLVITDDGGYIMSGWTLSFDVDSYDAWLVKISNAGLIEWQKTYNVTYDDGVYTWSGNEWAYRAVQAADGGYAVAGDSDAMDDRNGDVWIFKVDSTGSLGCGIDTDTGGSVDGTAVVTVSDTYGQSSAVNTSAVVGASDSSAYNALPDVSTQCGIP